MEGSFDTFDLNKEEGIWDAFGYLQGDAMEVVDEIRDHTIIARKAMDLDPVDMNTLANEAVELSILNQRLSDRVWKAGVIERAARNMYETIRENHKVRLVEEEGMAAGVADSKKLKLASSQFNLFNQAKGLHDQLQYLRKASDKTIDSIRSKNSLEKTDYRNVGHST